MVSSEKARCGISFQLIPALIFTWGSTAKSMKPNANNASPTAPSPTYWPATRCIRATCSTFLPAVFTPLGPAFCWPKCSKAATLPIASTTITDPEWTENRANCTRIWPQKPSIIMSKATIGRTIPPQMRGPSPCFQPLISR